MIFWVIVVIAAICCLDIVRQNKRKHREAEEAERRKKEEQERLRREAEEAKKAEEERRQRARREKEDAINRNPLASKYRIDEIPDEDYMHTLTITEMRQHLKSGFVAFDLETTGLSYFDDAIVEIGAVKVVDGSIVDTYSQLVDPERRMPPAASRVNHITDDMLAGKPKIYEILPDFLDFVGDMPLVAHNFSFDARFLMQACLRNRFRSPDNGFDTMLLARYYPEATNKKLGTLAKEAGIDVGTAHRALDDAKTAAMLLLDALGKKRTSKRTQAGPEAGLPETGKETDDSEESQ